MQEGRGGVLTDKAREALVAELTDRERYLEAIRLHGAEHHLRKLARGWSVTTWNGGTYTTLARKPHVLAEVRQLALEVALRSGQIRARLTLDAYDRERADVTEEERMAGARAEAGEPRGFRRRRGGMVRRDERGTAA